MKELHLHSASPRQLDSIINQNQIIQLPVCPSARPSVRPPVRSSVDPSDYLEKRKERQFFLEIKHFPPAAWSHSSTVAVSFSCSVSYSFSRSCSVPFLLATPAVRLDLRLHRMEATVVRTDDQMGRRTAPSNLYSHHQFQFLVNFEFGLAIGIWLPS